MTSIPALNQNLAITDKDGFATAAFLRIFTLIMARIGGISGGSYNALTNVAGSLLWDVNASPVAVVTLVNGTNTMPSPLNLVPGLMYRLTIIQPASGAAGTISWASNFKWPGGGTPSLSTGNGYVDKIWFDTDGTNIYGMVAQGHLS